MSGTDGNKTKFVRHSLEKLFALWALTCDVDMGEAVFRVTQSETQVLQFSHHVEFDTPWRQIVHCNTGTNVYMKSLK